MMIQLKDNNSLIREVKEDDLILENKIPETILNKDNNNLGV